MRWEKMKFLQHLMEETLQSTELTIQLCNSWCYPIQTNAEDSSNTCKLGFTALARPHFRGIANAMIWTWMTEKMGRLDNSIQSFLCDFTELSKCGKLDEWHIFRPQIKKRLCYVGFFSPHVSPFKVKQHVINLLCTKPTWRTSGDKRPPVSLYVTNICGTKLTLCKDDIQLPTRMYNLHLYKATKLYCAEESCSPYITIQVHKCEQRNVTI